MSVVVYFCLDLLIKTDFRLLYGIFFSVKLVAFAACTLDFLLHSQPLSPFLSCLFSPAKIEVKWKNDLGYVTTGKIYLWSLSLLLIPLQLYEGFFQDFLTRIDHKFQKLKQKWNHNRINKLYIFWEGHKNMTKTPFVWHY